MTQEHLDHMTDGAWHDDCRWCIERRQHGGTGLSGDETIDVHRLRQVQLDRYNEDLADWWREQLGYKVKV